MEMKKKKYMIKLRRETVKDGGIEIKTGTLICTNNVIGKEKKIEGGLREMGSEKVKQIEGKRRELKEKKKRGRETKKKKEEKDTEQEKVIRIDMNMRKNRENGKGERNAGIKTPLDTKKEV